MTIRRQFIRYVSLNMLGMLGMSLYILADTFFIAKAVGANGITALNLVLPLYNLIFAFGAMIGVGSAIRFAVERNHGIKEAEGYFFHALAWATVLSLVFVFAGIFFPGKIIHILGGDEQIVATGILYTRIFLMFAPFFMWNHIVSAFVRNDGDPSIAMFATLGSNLFNIVFDYVLMFPFGLSMAGAALATALSPIVSIFICMKHFRSSRNTILFKPVPLSIRKLFFSCQVGVSAFVGEISSGVITVAFNTIILGLSGNVGVAAYGVVANFSLVAVALFNGIAQGSQPLISRFYGQGDKNSLKTVIGLALKTALCVATVLLVSVQIWSKPMAGIFNREQDMELASLAEQGLRIYFTGFLFAGINIVGANILSAVESVQWAFLSSMSRGFIAILTCACLLSFLFGMNGVWLAFPCAELMTMLLTLTGIKKFNR